MKLPLGGPVKSGRRISSDFFGGKKMLESALQESFGGKNMYK